MSGRYNSNDRFDDGRIDHRYGRDGFHRRDDYDDRDYHDRRDDRRDHRDRSYSPRGGYGRSGFSGRGGRGSSRDYYGRSGSYYNNNNNYYRNNDYNNNNNSRRNDGGRDEKEEKRGKEDKQEQEKGEESKETTEVAESIGGSNDEGVDREGFQQPPKNKTAKKVTVSAPPKGKSGNDNRYEILEQKMEKKVEDLGEKILKKMEELTPVKMETGDEERNEGESKSTGGSSKRKTRRQKKAEARKQLATKLELVDETEEAEDDDTAMEDAESNSKRKADTEVKSKQAKKSKTPIKATPTGKAVRKNSYGQEITPFLRDMSDDQKAIFHDLLSRTERGEKLSWTDFQSPTSERNQVAMAVNLAVLISFRRAKEHSLQVDINKLHAYIQFTAKVNLPKIINEEQYCRRQIEKVIAKSDKYSLTPTELTVKDYPNLFGSSLLKKLLDQPSRDETLDALALFIKRGWMDDPEYAWERIQQTSFNELKRMISTKGSVHKHFKDQKVDVTYTPPFQFNFESALESKQEDDSFDEDEEVVDEVVLPAKEGDSVKDVEMKEAVSMRVEGVRGTSQDINPAKSMGINADELVQLIDVKQRAAIIPKLRLYLMDIAPNHLKARGEHLNTVPTHRLITFLQPIPLLEYLEETGIFAPPLEQLTEEHRPQAETLVEVKLDPSDDESDDDSKTELFVSRMYIRSKTLKGHPGVHEPPSSVLQGLLHVASSLLKENGKTMYLLPFNTSSGVGPLDVTGDMGIVTTKQLIPYFGKVLAEQDGKLTQVSDQQVREGITWKQFHFKTSGEVKSLFPLTNWTASSSNAQPLKEWLRDKNLTTGAYETWKSGDTERELWLLAELDEFADPSEVKAEIVRRTGLSNSHFKVQESRVQLGDIETTGLCIVGNMTAEDEIDFKLNRFNSVSIDEAPLTYNIYPARTRMSCLETGTMRMLLSRLEAHQKYLDSRIIVKFTGLPVHLSPNYVPEDPLGIVPTPVGLSNNASIASLAASIRRPSKHNRPSPIKRIVHGTEPGVWLVVGTDQDVEDLKMVCLDLLAKLQKWAKVDSIRLDFNGLTSARQEELERKRAAAATPSKIEPITPTSLLSNRMDSSLQLDSTQKQASLPNSQSSPTTADITELRESISDIKGSLKSLEALVTSSNKPHVVTTSDGTTSASSFTTTIDNMQSVMLEEFKAIKEAVHVATTLSSAANEKIDTVRRGYDIESIILSRAMFGEPLLEMIDTAIEDHPELEDHMTPEGAPIAPHYHPPELAEELNKIPFETLESLMCTSQDFVKMKGAMLCQVCMKGVDRPGTTIVLCGMCEAPYHLQCSTCVTYTGDPEGRMICRQCRNIRRKVLSVELVRHCPTCFDYAKKISARMVAAGTSRHIRQRFRALEIAKCGLISEEAFAMLSKAEEVVMSAEMQASHKGLGDPELDASLLNSSLLNALDKSDVDVNMEESAPTANEAKTNLEMENTEQPNLDLKPAAKAPLHGSPSSELKPRTIFPTGTKHGTLAKVNEQLVDGPHNDDDELIQTRDEEGLLAGRIDNLGKKTPPLNDSMNTSASESLKSSKSSGSKSEKSKDTEASADSAELRYEEEQKRTLRSVGTRTQLRRSKRLQDDGYKEVDDEEDDED